MIIKNYKPIIQETIPAVQIDSSNIAELEKFYQTTFDIGSYIILGDEREDTKNVAYRRACVWSKEAFESRFEEVIFYINP